MFKLLVLAYFPNYNNYYNCTINPTINLFVSNQPIILVQVTNFINAVKVLLK